MNRKLATALVLVLVLGVTLVYAKKRLSFEHSEQLGDTEVVELQLDLAIAETTVKAGTNETLVEFSGEYDETFDEPTLRVEHKSGGKAFVYLESGDSNKKFSHNDIESGEFNVLLSPEPEYAIRCDVGLGDNHIDLTGLKIRRLEIDAGLAETELFVDKPNELEAEKVEIECGLGSLDTDHLGYLRFKRLTVDAGMGDVTIDLQGYEGQGTVDVNVGMGSADIIVSRGVGVKVYNDGGFMSSIDLDNMTKVRKNVWESEDYDTAEYTLEIDLSVGMGSVDLHWK
jgi:Cell wall-active antibiotics response LiaF, C-terminal